MISAAAIMSTEKSQAIHAKALHPNDFHHLAVVVVVVGCGRIGDPMFFGNLENLQSESTGQSRGYCEDS